MILIECIAALFSFAVALTYPLIGNRRLKKIEKCFVQISRRRGLAILLAGAAALTLRAIVLPILPVPYPWIADEQSYLLQADTFAHGRLTNPSHPLWTHFESPNVIQQPTYSSIYYPAKAAFMAPEQVAARSSVLGPWLRVGLMCGGAANFAITMILELAWSALSGKM